MRTESVRKVIRVGSVLLIGLAICVSVWFFLREHKARELQGQRRGGIDAGTQTTPQPAQDPGKEPLTREERITRQARSMFMSSFSEEQLALPHFQKILEAMDSPEYVELLRSSDFSTSKREDFWKSKGVPAIQGHSGLFTEHPPFMSLADYERVVRRQLAELFIAAEPVDLTDPVAAGIQRGKILIELDETDENGLAWFMERFGSDWIEIVDGAQEGMENNPAVIWLNDIQQNAERIIEDAKQARVDALEASAPSWDLSSVMESPPVFPDEMEGNRPGMVVPSIDTDKQYDTEKRTAATPMVDPEKGVTDVLPTLPEAPTGEEVETALREQFSSERFDRAMSTLERYGPEEGLRRLKESDPEVAEQVERHRNRTEISK